MIYSDIFYKYFDTIIIYLLVIISSSTTAGLSYQYKRGTYRFNQLWFLLSFFILVIFLGFADIGADYEQYKNIFNRSLERSYWASTRIEKGYLLFNAIIKMFTSNFAVFHFLWALAMLFLIYSTICKFRSVINPGWAILAYTSFFMFQSMNLMRIYFAIAIIFWGVRFIISKKYIKYCITIFVAFLFHKTALCIFVPFIIWRLFSRKEYYFAKMFVSVLIFAILYLLRFWLFDGTFLGYSYAAYDSSALGGLWIVYHFPIFVLFWYYRFRNQEYVNDEFVSSMFVFLCVSTVMWIISYFIDGIGRATFYFTYPFIIFPQYLVTQRIRLIRSEPGINVNDNSYIKVSIPLIIFIIYCLFRAYMMLGYLVSDGLQEYTNILF